VLEIFFVGGFGTLDEDSISHSYRALRADAGRLIAIMMWGSSFFIRLFLRPHV
jgi:hypothetical protein